MACISTPSQAHPLARSSNGNHGLVMNEVVDVVGWELEARISYIPHTAEYLTNAFLYLPPSKPYQFNLLNIYHISFWSILGTAPSSFFWNANCSLYCQSCLSSYPVPSPSCCWNAPFHRKILFDNSLASRLCSFSGHSGIKAKLLGMTTRINQNSTEPV